MNTQLTTISLDSIDKAEKTLLSLPQAPCDVIHKFAPGLYIRELHMQAGTLAIGHEQRYQHYNVMLQGKVQILRDDGSTTVLEAPLCFIGKPGRKIGYVLEDMVWQNIYATTETSVDKLEEMFLIKSDTWKEHDATRQGLLALKGDADRSDFDKMISDLSVSKELVSAQSNNTEDLISIVLSTVTIAPSTIHGSGIFATASFQSGAIIGPARLEDKRTQLGRYTNHSISPNSETVMLQDGNIYLRTLYPIQGCLGGDLGEEITIDYRQAVKTVLEALCQE